ncbi:MAG: class I SAM-dependent methyltransferase [Thiobacillaceae bacterium]
MSISERTGEYKKAVIELFDTRIDYHRSALHARVADNLVQLAAPKLGDKVLDLATGTGFVALRVARLVGARGSVVGVDLSSGMLKQAEQAAHDERIDNVKFIQADAENFNYRNERFDLIFCCNALAYMSDIPSALRHWHALLRHGGRIALNCWSEDSYVTGHLLRTVAARHGIHVAVIGRVIATSNRCRNVLSNAGFLQVQVTAEPTAKYFSVEQLESMPESAMKNPLYRIKSKDAGALREVIDEYIAEARSEPVRNAINAEIGAFFVLACK